MKILEKIIYIIKNLLNALIDIIYPTGIVCEICDEHIDPNNKYPLCKSCYEDIEFLKKEDLEHDIVIKELKEFKYYNSKVIEDIYILSKYSKSMTRIIQGLKYNEKTYYSKLIDQLISNEMQIDFAKFDFISYVPIHKKRLYSRGFNQSKLIAEEIGKSNNLKLIKIVDRIKNTESLYNLSPNQRQNQMKDAFKINKLCKINGNESIIIVDDVLTTGATIQNMALEIKKSYKNVKIYLIFVSRTSIKN